MVEVRIKTDAGVTLFWDWATTYVAGVEEAVRRGTVLSGADFRGQDLHGGNFRSATMVGCHFEGANLRGADFTSANLTNSDFSGAVVTEATWTTATLTGCDLDALASAANAASAGTAIPSTEKAAASGVASLNASSLVVQNPANATATPTASKIPIAPAAAPLLDAWMTAGRVTTVPGAYPYTVLVTDGVVACDGGAGPGNVVVNLPVLATFTGNSPLVFKLVASTGGGVDLTPDAAETIEGLGAGAPYNLLAVGQVVALKPNAAHTGWDLLTAFPVVEQIVAPTVPGAYPYAILAGDRWILADDHTGAGDNVATLPAATGSGRVISFVLRTIDGAGTFQIAPQAGEQINALGAGTAYTALDAVGDCLSLLDAGAGQWWQISGEVA